MPRPPETIHDSVIQQAAARPDAIAVQRGEEALTYGELVAAAGATAAGLIDRGTGPGDLVLVTAPRSFAMVTTLLGVLMAGGAYIAADERWPAATLERAHGMAATSLRLGSAGQDATLPGAIQVPDQVCAADGSRGRTGLPVIHGSDPCCVFFTSGSTGEPKGVLALHRGTLTRFRDVPYAPFDEQTVTLQLSPLPWDGLTLELWSPLIHGGRVVLHDGGPVTPHVMHRARDSGVNTIWLTSSLFSGLVEDDISSVGGFRQLMTGGERISLHHVRKFLGAHPGTALLAGYGPVETTAFATTYPLTASSLAGLDDIPLGFPLPRTTVTVRDGAHREAPAGTVGEICIGGEGLAAGYLGDPELTAAKFIEADGERLYRTGDYGWFDQAGRLRFAGRRDRQVKIRGNRIELYEVENAMRAVPSVVEAFAVAEEAIDGASVLVGHYTTTDGAERPAAVRSSCAARLPSYAVPGRLRHHACLPLTRNGKVDVRALTGPGLDALTPLSDVPEVARLQQIVAGIQGRRPGADEDLGEAGMDSLSAMRIAYQTSVAFGVVFEVSDLYRLRRLSTIAVQLPSLPLASQQAGDDTELTGQQLDWWLREQVRPGDPGALVACAFRIVEGEISAETLAAAIGLLTEEHPALRTRIDYTPAGLRLAPMAPGTQAPVETCDDPTDFASGLPESWYRPFDLERGPAWRVCLGRDTAGAQVVVLILHHVLIDGWSESLLVKELGRAWRVVTGQIAGRPPVAPRGPVRVRPAVAQADPKPFWAHQLAGTTQLPLAPGGPACADRTSVGRWFLNVDAGRCDPGDLAGQILADRPAAEVVQARLLAAWGRALAAAGERGRYAVGVAYAGRDHVPEDELGCFVELLPVVLDTDASPRGAAASVARRWLGALEHRSLPLPEMLGAAGGVRGGNGLQTVFLLQTNPPAELHLGHAIKTERLELSTAAPLFPIAVEVWLRDGGYTIRLEWDRKQVDDGWAERMHHHYAAAIADLGCGRPIGVGQARTQTQADPDHRRLI
ncbi:MAG TPA: AMP-binding protein [Streptosporangiaceae bacterium]|nr:AMP-binding protein [Streptosporangiaceae bacterium]